MIPTGKPGTPINMKPIDDGSIWKSDNGFPLFCRYTTHYDCGYPTEWWYCLKDDSYDLKTLKAKKRYRVNKGKKFFYVTIEDENIIKEDIISIQIKAYAEYPIKYRPNINRNSLGDSINNWKNQAHTLFVARSLIDDVPCGYALINEYDDYLYYVQQKAIPEYEKNELNAVLVDSVLSYYAERITEDHPIVDGQRNTNHETGFQDYLCSVFGFRKAYCELHIKYRFWVKVIISALYPFRNYISKSDRKLFNSISSLLKMEEICKSFNER